MSRPRLPFLLGYALRQAPAPAFLSSAPVVFLSSYCTNFIDCGFYKNSVKNCHAFSLQSNNQYLAQSHRKQTTYSFLTHPEGCPEAPECSPSLPDLLSGGCLPGSALEHWFLLSRSAAGFRCIRSLILAET